MTHERDASARSEPSGVTERAALRRSWHDNAGAWTAAVREQRIPSRRVATDAAILAACERALGQSPGMQVMDVGCGEGWLARALAERGADVTGIDASAELVRRAAEQHGTSNGGGGGTTRFEVVAYEQLEADPVAVRGPFDLVVCNFALLDDRAGGTLAALRQRLAPQARLLVQTVHPWVAVGDGEYEDGWRLERFDAFEQPFPSTMPWFFRTLGSWIEAAVSAGLRLESLEEPLHPETRRPLSLLLTFIGRS